MKYGGRKYVGIQDFILYGLWIVTDLIRIVLIERLTKHGLIMIYFSRQKKIVRIVEISNMCCWKSKTSSEELFKYSVRENEKDIAIPRSKVSMRRVRKGNSPFVWFVGPPGLGKRSLAAMVAQEFGYVFFDAPTLLKEEAKKPTPRGQSVSWLMMNNRSLPNHLLLDLVKEEMAKAARTNNAPPAWLLCGYPFYLEEAYSFEAEIGRVGLVLYLYSDVPTMVSLITEGSYVRDRSPPHHLAQHLQTYMERLQPLLEAYVDRVERLEAGADAPELWDQVRDAIVTFEMVKPAFNQPTKATQKDQRSRRLTPYQGSGRVRMTSFHPWQMDLGYSLQRSQMARFRLEEARLRLGAAEENVVDPNFVHQLVTPQLILKEPQVSRPSLEGKDFTTLNEFESDKNGSERKTSKKQEPRSSQRE